MDNQRMPKAGEIYKHFKNNLYQIITVAIHSETGEFMVVYQALYGDFKTYVRTLAMFLSEVDHEKYPEIKQKYRFELFRPQTEGPFSQISNQIMDTEPKAVVTPDIDIINTNTNYAVNQVTEDNKTEVNKIKDNKIEDNKIEDNKIKNNTVENNKIEKKITDSITNQPITGNLIHETKKDESVNTLLLQFLDAESYNKKLEVLTSNIKHMNDRLINDMAVSLDCTVDEGPLDQRIQGLIYCLQAMCRFEDRRLR